MEEILLGLLVFLIAGALIGLIPFILGRYMGKPGLANLGMLCCVLFSPFAIGLVPFIAIGFVIAILVKKDDYHRPGFSKPASHDSYSPPPSSPASRPVGNLQLSCLSGPLRGQTYPIGAEGLLLGREPSCGVCFPQGTPGISGRHCQIRWQQGVLVLSDLNSTYGTFLGDGRKLPPNYPMQIAAGSRFYLANASCLFQITLI